MKVNSEPNQPADLEELVARFEDAWQQGPRPDLAVFLSAVAGPRRSALIELVHTDLEYRWRAGEPARVEEYLQRFPELADEPEVVVELLATEQGARAACGQSASLAEYLQRF